MEKITDKKKSWYNHWFGSPYYHILYKHRDAEEAEHFLDNLADRLELKKECRILDMACGSGRHSLYLSQKGFKVTGIDLSDENIASAKKKSDLAGFRGKEHKKAEFVVHDMRKIFKKNYFDVVLNLFTSFGYFEDRRDDLKILVAANTALKSQGIFVLDFMNVKKIIPRLKRRETKTMDSVKFTISRSVKKGFIIKKIKVEDLPGPEPGLKGRKVRASGTVKFFQEKVRALTLRDFEKYFLRAGFVVRNIFGDYDLSNFDGKNSARLIFVLAKK